MEVEISKVSENGIQGFELLPENILYEGVILNFGGSEGSS